MSLSLGQIKGFAQKTVNKKNFQSKSIKRQEKTNIFFNKERIGYIVHKKDKCENCGFTPIHMCQLDVDHIDGNHKNNNISNLQTLCSNCHRLKTYVNKDWRINN